ncbi:MAG: GAF domain-containing protein [Leptospira sp.]|nr:GAF domain-containing protein [Leptospira sp.]
MSLLEKASQHIEVESSKPSGLLKRAEGYRNELLTQPSIPDDFQPTGLLKKAERILEKEKELENEVLQEPPIVDDFDLWEEEARESSEKTPIQPQESDQVPSNEDYLFDDDSDFTTAPIEYHLASKKRIENYHSIFEITKELAGSSDFDSFFSNLNYSLIGQIGAETFAVFSSVTEQYETLSLLEHQGFEPTSDWTFHENDETYRKIKDSDSVIYAGELLSSDLPTKERDYLEAMQAEILAPIRNGEKFFGFIVLGHLINGEEYITDDLEFVKIIGDIAGSVFERVREFEARANELEKLETIVRRNGSVLDFARDISGVRKFDTAYDLMIDYLKDHFGLQKFTFMVFDPKIKDEYKVFASNQISPNALETFRFGRNSDLVGMISNISGVYRLDDFQSNSELCSLLSNDELGVMDDFVVIPMINLNWLVGIMIVHQTSMPWTDSDREVVLSMMEVASPVFANIMILDERDNAFRNPFSPLEDRLDTEISKASDLNTAFTVVVFKVQSIPRMIQLLGHSYFGDYCDGLRKSIQEHLGENDHYIRVGQGKFVAIFHSKDKEEAEIVIRKIKSDFSPKELDGKTQFKPSFRILSLEYPRESKLKEQFVEMVDEA